MVCTCRSLCQFAICDASRTKHTSIVFLHLSMWASKSIETLNPESSFCRCEAQEGGEERSTLLPVKVLHRFQVLHLMEWQMLPVSCQLQEKLFILAVELIWLLSKVYFLTNANVNSRWILSFVFLFKINIDMNEMRYMAAIEIDRIQGGFDVAIPLSSIRYVRNRWEGNTSNPSKCSPRNHAWRKK